MDCVCLSEERSAGAKHIMTVVLGDKATREASPTPPLPATTHGCPPTARPASIVYRPRGALASAHTLHVPRAQS